MSIRSWLSKTKKELLPSWHYLKWQIAVFAAVPVVVVLSNTSVQSLTDYLETINYIIIFGATIPIGLFTYCSLGNHVSPKAKDDLILYAEIMLASTIIFTLSLLFLPSESVLNGSQVEIIGEGATVLCSIGLLFSIAFFVGSMIETMLILSTTVLKKIHQKVVTKLSENEGKVEGFLDDALMLSPAKIRADEHPLVSAELQEAMSALRDTHSRMREMALFLLGLFGGVLTNMLVNGLWDWDKIYGKLTIQTWLFIIGAVGTVIIAWTIYGLLKGWEKDSHGLDNILRFHYNAREVWNSDGKLIPNPRLQTKKGKDEKE